MRKLSPDKNTVCRSSVVDALRIKTPVGCGGRVCVSGRSRCAGRGRIHGDVIASYVIAMQKGEGGGAVAEEGCQSVLCMSAVCASNTC